MNQKKQTALLRGRGFCRRGEYHAEREEPCQDVLRITEEADFCFYGLADGRTGAEAGAEGARAVLKEAEDWIRETGVGALEAYPYPDELPCLLLRRIRRRLEEKSREEKRPMEAYGSTLLAVGADPVTGRYLLIHLGDGCAVGVREETAQILSPPENGVTRCHTWLTTSPNGVYHLRIRFGSWRNQDRILLLSDGAEGLCRGKRILQGELVASGTAEELGRFLQEKKPMDDASFLLLEKL